MSVLCKQLRGWVRQRQTTANRVELVPSLLRTSSLSGLLVPADVWPSIWQAGIRWQCVSALTAVFVAVEVAETKCFTVTFFRGRAMNWRLPKYH
jgi:hypothetical protein